MFSVLVIRLRSLRLLRVSGIVMRLRMFLLLITFLKASHSFRNRLLVICKNAYLFADRKSGSAGMPRPISYAVFCLKKKKNGMMKLFPTPTKKSRPWLGSIDAKDRLWLDEFYVV